jgi:serine protease inhibitor
MKRNYLRSLIILVPLLVIFSSSCKKTDDLPKEPVQIPLSEAQTAIIDYGNTFAFDIFKKVVESQSPAGNLMISPLSISYALSMTLNGANGATRDSMMKALRVNGLSIDEINGSFKVLTDALTTIDTRVAISIANSVWIDKRLTVKVPFINTLKDSYAADTKDFDITDPKAVDPVNKWISDKTNGLIPKMLDNLQDNTVMLLINAIYFKGKWKSEFEKSNTENRPFYKSSGTISTPCMYQESECKIYEGNGFKVGEFPYGQGNFVMDIILPDSNDGASGMLASITPSAFNSWISQMTTNKVSLYIPKFKYSYKKGLKEILTDMGMGIAFTDNADLSNISDTPMLINDVKHNTYIETNEEGTEAAAATVVEVGITSAGPSPEFRVDHPFFYIIRESTTNSILFMGKVADPSAS